MRSSLSANYIGFSNDTCRDNFFIVLAPMTPRPQAPEMSDNSAASKTQSGIDRFDVPGPDRLFDIAASLALTLAVVLAYISFTGGGADNQLPLLSSYIVALLFVAFLGFYVASRPAICYTGDGFVLLRRRPFGRWKADEPISLELVSGVRVIQTGRRTAIAILELTDGRHLRVPRSRLGRSAENALVKLSTARVSGR